MYYSTDSYTPLRYSTISSAPRVCTLVLFHYASTHIQLCLLSNVFFLYSIFIVSGAYEPPEGRKERPTPHYSVERHLNLNGRHTSLIWTYSQVGRKCCFHNQLAMLHAQRSRCTACRTALAMTVNELHVFLSSQLKQERERKIERLGKRQALYTRLYFPRGIRSRKWPSYVAICGVRDTAYFRRCASSSLGIFLRVYVASWLAAFRAFRSHVLFFLFHRCELRTSRTTSNYFTIVAGAVRGRYNANTGRPAYP